MIGLGWKGFRARWLRSSTDEEGRVGGQVILELVPVRHSLILDFPRSLVLVELGMIMC